MATKPDPRDGSMTGINGPMSPAQVETFARCPDEWADMHGVSEMILRSLKDLGVVPRVLFNNGR